MTRGGGFICEYNFIIEDFFLSKDQERHHNSKVGSEGELKENQRWGRRGKPADRGRHNEQEQERGVKHSSNGKCLLSNMPDWHPSVHIQRVQVTVMIPCPKCGAPKNALLKRGQQDFLQGNLTFPNSINMKTKIMNPPVHLLRTLKEFKLHSSWILIPINKNPYTPQSYK